MAALLLALPGFRSILNLSCVYSIFLANLFCNLKKYLFVCVGGEKEEGDDGQDLRRTESDSGLKKVFFPKRRSLPPSSWALLLSSSS